MAAGLRYDDYQLLLNQSAFRPRFSVSRYISRGRSAAARFLRPCVSNACVRKYSPEQFAAGGCAEQSVPPSPGRALARRVLRRRSHPRFSLISVESLQGTPSVRHAASLRLSAAFECGSAGRINTVSLFMLRFAQLSFGPTHLHRCAPVRSEPTEATQFVELSSGGSP